MSIPSDDLHNHDSDSDAISDDEYHPISAADSDHDGAPSPAGLTPFLPNGIHDGDADGEEAEEDEIEDEEEEEEKRMEEAASRALRENEERRAAPMTAENAARVVDAMRGIDFPGVVPDWAGCVSEDRWRELLRRLRDP